MAIYDRIRSLAGFAGARLLRFSATPPVRGFEPLAGMRQQADRDPSVVQDLRSPEAMRGRTTYGASPSRARYSTYPATNLEPTGLWSIQVQRNNGYPQLWVEMCEQILERDGHLGGLFDSRRQNVSDKPFRVHPANRTDPVSRAVASFTERALDACENWDEGIEDLLSACAYGYALSEIVWSSARVTFPMPNGGTATADVLVPKSIEWVHWKHLRFDLDTDEPYLWLRNGEYRFPPNKFIFHGANGTGLTEKRGFMGACSWLSAAKRWSERDWLIYAKLFGIPFIHAKFSEGQEQYDAHRDEYERMLKDFGEGIPIVLPESLQLDVGRESAGRSGDVHGAIIGWANAEMSKRVLGSTLTVEMGGQGSWAAADTHRDAPYVRSRADARKLAGTIRRDLCCAIVRVNATVLARHMGAPPDTLVAEAAKCSWRIEREMSPEARSKVYTDAVNELGLEIDAEAYMDEMGLDPVRPGGKMLRGRLEKLTAGGGLVSTVQVAQADSPTTTGGAGVTPLDTAAKTAAKAQGAADSPLASASAPEPERPAETTAGAAATINLTSTDLAVIVTVNEARRSQGLPPLEGEDGALTVAEFKAKHSATVAEAAAAGAGKTEPESAPAAAPTAMSRRILFVTDAEGHEHDDEGKFAPKGGGGSGAGSSGGAGKKSPKWSPAKTTPIPQKEGGKPGAPPGSQLEPNVVARLKEIGARLPPAHIAGVQVSEHLHDPEKAHEGAVIKWKTTTKSGKVKEIVGVSAKQQEASHQRIFARTEQQRAKMPELQRELEAKAVESPVHAAAALIAETGLRRGSDDNEPGHFGALTMEARHIAFEDGRIARIEYVGKEGIVNRAEVTKPALVQALLVARDHKPPDEPLWPRQVSEATVQKVLLPGQKIKDLRTIVGTNVAERELNGIAPRLTGDEKKDARAIAAIIKQVSTTVAAKLNNKPAQAKESYIASAVWHAWAEKHGVKQEWIR